MILKAYVVIFATLQLVVPHLLAGMCPEHCECSTWLGTYVACRGTDLSDVPLNTFIPKLESFYFTYNKKMTILKSGSLEQGEYTSVRVLILNNNAINTIEPNALRGMAGVRQLDLSANNISTIPREVFQSVKRLSRLNLFSNKHLELPEEGYFLPKLTLLVLRGCQLQTIPLNFFKNMQNLKNIKLDRNKFSVLDANVFRPVLQKLKILDLSINKFTKLPKEVLELLPMNVELHLEYNRYHCDCEFEKSIFLYEERVKSPRLSCATPREMRGVDGFSVKQILNCNGDINPSLATAP